MKLILETCMNVDSSKGKVTYLVEANKNED